MDVSKSNLLIKWFICFALAALCFILPLGPAYTFLCQKFTASTVFCIALLAFDLLNPLMIGLFLPALWVLLGCATFNQALSGWSGSFLFMLLGAFTFTNTLNRCGVLKRAGYKIILLCGGTLNGAIWGLFFSSIVLDAASFTMGQALPITLALAVYYSLELKPKDPESMLVVLALILGATQANAYLYSPISISLIQSGIAGVLPEYKVSAAELIMHNLPVFVFSVLLLWGFMKVIGKKSTRVLNVENQRTYFKNELAKMGPVSLIEKKALIVLALMVVFMLLSPVHGLDMSFGFLFAAMAMFLPIINAGKAEDVTSLGNMLPIISITFAFMSIGAVGTACGFGAVISSAVTPFMSQFGAVGSVYAVLLLATLSNFILTPAAMLVLLSAPVAQFCMDLGYNFMPHINAIYLAEHAIFHPYEWPSYMTIFAFGMLQINDFVKVCVVKAIFYLLFISAIMIPLWYLVGWIA